MSGGWYGIIRRRTAHNDGYIADSVTRSQRVAVPVESSLGDFERIEARHVGGRKGRSLVVIGDPRILRGYFCSEINMPRTLDVFSPVLRRHVAPHGGGSCKRRSEKPFRIPESAASSSGR
jgi:hypothetical protein